MFQAYNLVPTLTALENVMLALDLRGASLADAPYLAWEALDAVGLSHRAHTSPSKLSGGEKQRVAIARALAGSPSVILADEPTAALDSENGKAVMELLAEVAKDTRRAVLVVTHDHRTLEYGDRMIRIEDGAHRQPRPPPPDQRPRRIRPDRGRMKFAASVPGGTAAHRREAHTGLP